MNQVWHSARAWRGRERRTFGISGGGFRQASKSIVFVPSRIFKLDHLGVREVRSGSKVQTNSLLECECAQTALISILLTQVVDIVDALDECGSYRGSLGRKTEKLDFLPKQNILLHMAIQAVLT